MVATRKQNYASFQPPLRTPAALPPLKMTLSPQSSPMGRQVPPSPAGRSWQAPPSPAGRSWHAPQSPPPKPQLARRSSSVERIITKVAHNVETLHRNLREAFRSVDRDCSGALTRDELQAALFQWKVNAQTRHVDGIMDVFDKDGDARISYAEFCEGLKPFSVPHDTVFGMADRYVTERYRVLQGAGGRVLLNDNLSPPSLTPRATKQRQQPLQQQPQLTAAPATARPDYELYELPRSAKPASPAVLKGQTELLQNRIHEKYRDFRKAFLSFDENKDGKLSKQELLRAVRCFNLPFPQEHVEQLAALCDANGDGLIDYSEFAALLKRKDALGN